MPPPRLSEPIKAVNNIRILDNHHEKTIKDIKTASNTDRSARTITSLHPNHHERQPTSNHHPLALPSLTHPHIHLDKAFIHNSPEYSDLLPSTGSFQEALSLTAKAKQRFTYPDLIKRGEWLLAESVAAGVTAMRAFVEVDHTVDTTCLEAGLALKDAWRDVCDVQIVCFAQDPVFSTSFGDANRTLMEKSIGYPGVDVLGTTPYVETDIGAAKANIDWAIETALRMNLHLDFHLDYNLDRSREPLVWYVVERMKAKCWTRRSTDKRVMLGHCTRLTLFTGEEWRRLARVIRDDDLPVSFVGLPTSDLYMASPPPPTGTTAAVHEKPRGTFLVPEMIREYGLDAVMGVNNVGNAFTPWGSPDPLSLACLGVGVYQARKQADAELLYECVSVRARAAIGLSGRTSRSLTLREGDEAEFLVFYNADDTGCDLGRARRSVADVVWDPPARVNRGVVRNGRLILKPAPALRTGSSLETCMIAENGNAIE